MASLFSLAGAHVRCALATALNRLQPGVSSAFGPYLDDEIVGFGPGE